MYSYVCLGLTIRVAMHMSMCHGHTDGYTHVYVRVSVCMSISMSMSLPVYTHVCSLVYTHVSTCVCAMAHIVMAHIVMAIFAGMDHQAVMPTWLRPKQLWPK